MSRLQRAAKDVLGNFNTVMYWNGVQFIVTRLEGLDITRQQQEVQGVGTTVLQALEASQQKEKS